VDILFPSLFWGARAGVAREPHAIVPEAYRPYWSESWIESPDEGRATNYTHLSCGGLPDLARCAKVVATSGPEGCARI